MSGECEANGGECVCVCGGGKGVYEVSGAACDESRMLRSCVI